MAFLGWCLLPAAANREDNQQQSTEEAPLNQIAGRDWRLLFNFKK
jgi:hypothetical protein